MFKALTETKALPKAFNLISIPIKADTIKPGQLFVIENKLDEMCVSLISEEYPQFVSYVNLMHPTAKSYMKKNTKVYIF